MEVNRSGYYRYIEQITTAKESDIVESNMIIEMKALHKKTRQSYGSRRMSRQMQAKGYNAGRYKVRRVMRENSIECKQRRRYKVTTMSRHDLPIAENKLDRNFTVFKPNKVWVADITYLWTLEGWLYVSAVVDLFSRRVVGWAMASTMHTELIANALIMAINRRQPDSDLMHHSDRGSQYASQYYQDLLKKLGITVSMSRKGNCWDNAVMERFFGSLKSERTDGITYLSRRQAKDDVIEYIEMFYNTDRLHSTLGYLSPMIFEKQQNPVSL
jgi:Transposase and inactivated derivatives